jgi:beta-lactamase superfamily II metal-dependent hydrolase
LPWYSSVYFERGDPDALAKLQGLLPPGHAPVRGLVAGSRLGLADAEIEVLWPPARLGTSWPANDVSLVLRVRADGHAVLLTGDLEEAGVAGLLAAEREGKIDLRACVLVAPHHGEVLGELTAELLAAVSPEVVIVSTRTPRPRMKSLARSVLGPKAQVLLTGEVGAVEVHMRRGRSAAVRTPFAQSEGRRGPPHADR